MIQHNGKSLEAVWHRATLDLLAAIALIEDGLFVGDVISYKSGHGLDVEMIQKLYKESLLVPLVHATGVLDKWVARMKGLPPCQRMPIRLLRQLSADMGTI